jgi:hypothetical protein
MYIIGVPPYTRKIWRNIISDFMSINYTNKYNGQNPFKTAYQIWLKL